MATERLAALKDGSWMEFWETDNPKCPHCGDVFDIQANEAWHLYEESEQDVECSNPLCKHTFTVAVNVQYSFSTDDQPEDDE